MTQVGDELEVGGARCRVTDVGPMWGYVKDKNGKEREQVIATFVHVERVQSTEEKSWTANRSPAFVTK